MGKLSAVEDFRHHGSRCQKPERRKVSNYQNRFLAACIHLCQLPSINRSGNERSGESSFVLFFTPAGADGHPLTGGGVGDGSVVVDQGGVESHAVDIQGHRGKLHAE